jgi:hypothetical protein
MRRATLLLASTLAAAAIAGALVYGPDVGIGRPGAPAVMMADEFAHPQAAQPQSTSAGEPEPNVSAPQATGATVPQDAKSPTPPADDRTVRRRRSPPRDEATILADLRKRAIQDLRQSYSLLFDDLELTPQERDDLVAVLVELQVESAWSGGPDGEFQKRGRTIGPQERHDRIAAAIGDKKLDEFLVLEVNGPAYWEAQQIASLLRRKQVPLTETQRDRMFEIVVEVRDRYSPREADVDPRSLEYLEQQIEQMDDFDRHIIELAPSVLSATQVAFLSDEYQWMSQQRINAVEMQTKRRAERPDSDVGTFLPDRWNPR